MTTVMNQKLARAYIKTLQDKLTKKVKLLTKKITTQDVIQMILDLLPTKNTVQSFSNSSHTQSATAWQIRDAIQIIQRNQDTIVDNRCQIQYLKRKIQLEDSLMASFVKTIMKQRNNNSLQNLTKTALKRQSSSLLNLPNPPSLSRYDSSRIQPKQLKLDDSLFDKSPIGNIQRSQLYQNSQYAGCNTSRSKISPIKFQSPQYSQYLQPQQKQKIKALAKLRKLQKYVFEKQNIHKDKSLSKIYNCGVSPSKMRYKQENQNLKVIQSNLVTHLSIMEKYREIPSIQGLVARQEALKKKQKHLKQLGQVLDKKQLSLNKKHSQFLKKQKSQRVL